MEDKIEDKKEETVENDGEILAAFRETMRRRQELQRRYEDVSTNRAAFIEWVRFATSFSFGCRAEGNMVFLFRYANGADWIDRIIRPGAEPAVRFVAHDFANNRMDLFAWCEDVEIDDAYLQLMGAFEKKYNVKPATTEVLRILAPWLPLATPVDEPRKTAGEQLVRNSPDREETRKDTILRIVAAKGTDQDIADALGVVRPTATKWRAALGIPPSYPPGYGPRRQRA